MKWLKEYFVFSSSERRGIFAFSVIIFLMILAYAVMPILLKSPSQDFTEFDKELNQLMTSNSEYRKEELKPHLFRFNPNTISRDSLILLGLSSKQAYNVVNYRKKVGEFKNKKDFKKIYSIPDSLYLILENKLFFKEIKYMNKTKKGYSEKNKPLPIGFKLNPNTAEVPDLIKLGLSSKQAHNIINYRNKVGKFTTKEELKKLYTIKDKDYLKIESYLKIPVEVKKDSVFQTPKVYKPQILSININTATAQKFQEIRGIGAKTAKRIIELREELGGFYDGEQLLEVYRIDTIVILNNLSNFRINLHKISKLNLNRVTFKELLRHPYISYSQTRRIITYREMHGDFKSVEEILTNNLIKDKHYRKIVHYLTVE